MRPESGTNQRLARLSVAAVAAATMLGGCAYFSQINENAKPTAVPAMRQAQMLNPDAGRNRKAVTGLDGRVAGSIQDGYANSFKAKAGAQQATETYSGFQGLKTD